MNKKQIIQKYLLSSNAYDSELLQNLLDLIEDDIKKIYTHPQKNKYCHEKNNKVLALIENYVSGFDDTNAGEILLTLINLPVIAKELKKNIEQNIDDASGLSILLSRNNTDEYMKSVFMKGYNTLYSVTNDKEIGINMYYECERFIDSLVLEFKQNIEPMIDENNLVYDDLLYMRRLFLNLANRNDNYSFVECEKCERDDCTYTRCETLPRKNAHEQEFLRYNSRVKLITKILEQKDVKNEEIQALSTKGLDGIIRRLYDLAESGDKSGTKKIEFVGEHKIFSIISAQRFGKILKRRYTEDTYLNDKDIYYMLRVGIDPQSIFGGDKLLDDLKKIKDAYSEDESLK